MACDKTESTKLAHKMTEMSEHFLWVCFAVFLRPFVIRFHLVLLLLGMYICADIWLRQIKQFICRVCRVSFQQRQQWWREERDDRVDFLSHAFFKKTCNDGDKDELRRERREKAAPPLNSIHWPNHLNQHHLCDDDDDNDDEVNVCAVLFGNTVSSVKEPTHTQHICLWLHA